MMIRNPFYKKIEPATRDEDAASYGGIALKSVWFWLLCAAGIAIHYYVPMDVIPLEMWIVGVGIAFICPFLTYWFPATASIAGSVYSVILGFSLAMICRVYAQEYAGAIYLAVGITALVFFITLLLYRSGIIKVNHKFRGILLTLFLASIAGSGIVYLSSFFTSTLVDLFWGNGAVAMIVTVVSLILATLNLVFEFDYASSLVKNRICKKYEWIAAYGLFMTVILIFIRVLELISKFMPDRE